MNPYDFFAGISWLNTRIMLNDLRKKSTNDLFKMRINSTKKKKYFEVIIIKKLTTRTWMRRII